MILTIKEVVVLLESTPVELANVTSSLQPDQLRLPADGDWSATDVLAHLRACADIWGGCILSILDGAQTLRAVNPRTWIDKTDYRSLDFGRSLLSFRRQREQLLNVLRRTPTPDWLRPVVVTGAGAPLHRDALSYGIRLARHERVHVAQVTRMVGAMKRLGR